MDRQLSPFEEELSAAMREFADHSEPLTIDPQRIIRGATHNRTRWAVAAAAAVLVAGGVGAAFALIPGQNHQPIQVASPTPTRTGTSPAPATTQPAPTTTASGGQPSGPATVSGTSTATRGGQAPTPGTDRSTDAVPTCQSTQLATTATTSASDGSGSHDAWAIVFTNNSATACQLTGYPTVRSISGNFPPMIVRYTPRGYLGGLPPGTTSPPPVILAAHGGTASALVEGTGNPSATPSSCDVHETEAAVTAPGASGSSVVDIEVVTCNSWEIHPVVSGPTGFG